MNPNSTYRPDIDGLRAVAVLAVVLHHLSASLVPGGYVGVDVFFVISGYLITRIISREMEEGTFTFARFYERRARRIFPALFAMLAVTLAVGYFLLLPSEYSATLRATLGTLFFSSNLVFWREMAAGYFAQDAKLNPLLHTWSLAVEEQFYVFFPILLLVCYRFFRKYIFWILLGSFLISLGGAAMLIKSKSVAVFFLTPLRAWELLAGSMLALGSVPTVRTRALREALVAGGLIAIVAACFMYDDKTTFPGIAALLPVLGATAIIYAGGSGPTVAGRLLRWRPVVYVGLMSYSLYLWHWPLIVLTQFANGMDPIKPYLPALFMVSMLLGSLSYHFIERPFRRGSRFATRRTVFSSMAAVASLLISVAVAGLLMNGYEGRFDATVVKLDQARFAAKHPFINCFDRVSPTWCVLGKSEVEPSTLLWGDSHLLAWAPAMNEIFLKQDKRAVFAPLSACAPLLDVESAGNSKCAPNNLAVKEYLLAHPKIKTVVMAAYWTANFREKGPLSDQQGDKGSVAAKNALISTVQWLREQGRQVILVGPVPVYDNSVPMVLALKAITSQRLSPSTATEQRHKNALFFSTVDAIPKGPLFRFIDPIQWFCMDDCRVVKDGIALYSDSNHLSVAGAMAMEANLAKGLDHSPAKRSDIDQVHVVSKQ